MIERSGHWAIERVVNANPRASRIRRKAGAAGAQANFVSGAKKLFRLANFSSIASQSRLDLKAVAAGILL